MAQGLNYLREFLHLPAEIVPATHMRPARPQSTAPTSGAYRPPRAGGGEDREYRRRGDGEKKEGAPDGYRPRFGGVGRGGPRE